MTTKIGDLTLKHYNENLIKVLEENGYILTKEHEGLFGDHYIVSIPCEVNDDRSQFSG